MFLYEGVSPLGVSTYRSWAVGVFILVGVGPLGLFLHVIVERLGVFLHV